MLTNIREVLWFWPEGNFIGNAQDMYSRYKLENYCFEITTASPGVNELTHWGRETHICVGKLTIIASDNGSSPGRRQAIIWTNAGILLIGSLGTNFNEILIEIHTFSFKKMHLKMSSAKWRPFCLGLNVLMTKTIDAMSYAAAWLCWCGIHGEGDTISYCRCIKLSVTIISKAWCKTAVSPLITHLRYCSLALSHLYFAVSSQPCPAIWSNNNAMQVGQCNKNCFSSQNVCTNSLRTFTYNMIYFSKPDIIDIGLDQSGYH